MKMFSIELSTIKKVKKGVFFEKYYRLWKTVENY